MTLYIVVSGGYFVDATPSKAEAERIKENREMGGSMSVSIIVKEIKA